MRDRIGERGVKIKPYILIGGRSSRFGRDKATFEFEGEMLAARALRVVEAAFPSSQAAFVSSASGKFLGRGMIADVYPDRGAAGAVHAALSDAKDGWIFILACDLPLLTPELINELSKQIDEKHGCVIPVQPDGRWQPLCAFYRVEKCLRVFEDAISGGGKHLSARAVAGTVDPRPVELSPDLGWLLVNVNTPDDLAGIQFRLHRPCGKI